MAHPFTGWRWRCYLSLGAAIQVLAATVAAGAAGLAALPLRIRPGARRS